MVHVSCLSQFVVELFFIVVVERARAFRPVSHQKLESARPLFCCAIVQTAEFKHTCHLTQRKEYTTALLKSAIVALCYCFLLLRF